MSEVTARIAARFGVDGAAAARDRRPVTTRIDAVDADDGRGARPAFPGVLGAPPRRRPRQGRALRGRRVGAAGAGRARGDRATPTPSCSARRTPWSRSGRSSRSRASARRSRRDATASSGVSGIVGGAPVAGMADRLMPAVGLEVTAAGAAAATDGLLAAWVIDERDRALGPARSRRPGLRVARDRHDHDATTTRAEALARAALDAGARREPCEIDRPSTGLPEVRPGDDLAALLRRPSRSLGRPRRRRRRRDAEDRLEGGGPPRARRRTAREAGRARDACASSRGAAIW